MPLLRVRVFYPFLLPVLSLGEVETSLVLVFEVEDHGDAFVLLGSYDFGSVKSSDIVVPVLVVFDSFLGIAHL